jgi:flagellar motor switch protein FliN
MEQTQTELAPASVRSGSEAAARGPLERISVIADVPLPIEVELDRKTLTVRGILALGAGSVLKLSRSAGENIDIRIGGSLVGFGEIVILEDSTGVRITDFWGES